MQRARPDQGCICMCTRVRLPCDGQARAPSEVARPMSAVGGPYPMSLRHALLAILPVQPMTGYDLTKHFDRSAANVWHAPHSQIYPELRKLESAGLVTAESVARGDHGIKRHHSITAPGLDVLAEWVDE